MSEQDPQVPPQVPPQEPTPAGAPPPPGAPGWAPQGPSGPRAGFGRRLVAAIVDGVLIAFAFVVIYVIALAIDEVLGAVVLFALVIAALAYFVVLEGGPTGQTVGKRLLDIRVIDQNTGGPIGYGRGAIRLVARYLSQLPCYLGYLWMLWDKEKQTWHDKLSSSVVVPVEYYPVSR